ncbi:hypothetical protein BD309DRAFT_971877 [Dichomitus squalens]|uniref:Uncharacterized protein n=1 Tax=Dichomitus squalens TaxID=114155 RepID=A0A4Q9MI45_9APHY|nr:hypothetical protein BD311DRAFT_492934 [Dichomitus squalens]TBU38460.1 hypothetical protein BD309DRAFT_971877 [Dichomitus squalens]
MQVRHRPLKRVIGSVCGLVPYLPAPKQLLTCLSHKCASTVMHPKLKHKVSFRTRAPVSRRASHNTALASTVAPFAHQHMLSVGRVPRFTGSRKAQTLRYAAHAIFLSLPSQRVGVSFPPIPSVTSPTDPRWPLTTRLFAIPTNRHQPSSCT